MFDTAQLAVVDPHVDEAVLIARIDELERVKSAAAAGQARAAAALDDKRRAVEAAAGVPKAKQGRGLGSEVGLARRDSADRGARYLNMAKTWCAICRTRWPGWSAVICRSGGRS
jgi:hypothetical protein